MKSTITFLTILGLIFNIACSTPVKAPSSNPHTNAVSNSSDPGIRKHSEGGGWGSVKDSEVSEGLDNVEVKSASTQPSSRVQEEAPLIVIMSYKDNGFSNSQNITQGEWNSSEEGFGRDGRYHLLRKLYYLNTKNLSPKSARQQSCFEGSAQDVGESFFGKKSGEIQELSNDRADFIPSSDGRLLAISFEDLAEKDGLGSKSFRMYHCGSLKTPPTDYAGAKLPEKNYAVYKKVQRGIASTGAKNDENQTDLNKAFLPKSHDRNYGFVTLDSTADPATKYRFTLRGDYSKAVNSLAERPWKGLNVRDKTEALKFSDMVLFYVLKNMANQNPKADENFSPYFNAENYWCHAPWKHVGAFGREAIHGLHYLGDQRTPSGTNWGLTLYNNIGCQTLYNIFGSATDPRTSPDFSKVQFADGTLISQLVFTTAQSEKWKTAFSWNANVFEPGSRVRTVKPVRLMEINVAVKDSSLLGSQNELGNWVMLTFVFDSSYSYEAEIKRITGTENPLKSLAELPKSFLKFRPIGVQTGFDKPSTLDTLTFVKEEFLGVEGRLNSPSGNSRSSCLGCHATSGTSVSMSPGFLNMKQYSPFAQDQKLDFNLELSTAKSNWETEGPR